MHNKRLFLNTLTFDYPVQPVKFYFSATDDAEHKSTMLKSPTLFPKELKEHPKYSRLIADNGTLTLYTFFDQPAKGFDGINIDFHTEENQYLVKRYYNRRLEHYFSFYDNVVVTRSGITSDIQLWIRTDKKNQVTYQGKQHDVFEMDRFTLRVKYDTFNHRPYLLVTDDRPSLLLNITLQKLFERNDSAPFDCPKGITPSMVNLVMTRKGDDGKGRIIREINKYDYLQAHNKYCPPKYTRPIMGKQLKQYFGLDKHNEPRTQESKYIKYLEKIEDFRKKYLNSKEIECIFRNLAYSFTLVNPMQVGRTDSAKRKLVFGNDFTNMRQQVGVNEGPHIKCPHTDVQMIFIFPEKTLSEARNLIQYMRNGGYQNNGKPLSFYIGSNVGYAARDFHITVKNEQNPVPEVAKALQQRDCYRNRDKRIKYVGIYITPIHKYASSPQAKECYYKIKELFLKHDIPTQCIERDKMNNVMERDKKTQKANFAYTLQNMGVAICAKLGGSPWLLDETEKKELIIGIGAFRSDNRQYIGAAFSFDNTGAFNDYCYFQKSELNELVGAIKMAILRYSAVNSQPERIIIHYYKKISRKREFSKMEEMLNCLNLDVPVYIVTINKTESEDIVVFDKESTYTSYNYQTRQKETHTSLMPHSGTWVNLGLSREGHRYLLCNNTRYEDEQFNATDGFPFPVKLTIACPNRNDIIDTPVVQQLIEQVYQFSRIYWKSVKQQGLPVTIKYPEMIAEIMPHFNDCTIYTESKCLWFL